MENIYEKYYLSDESTIEMLKKAVVIFDTSALLDLYYYSEVTLNAISDNVFEYLKKRLWIPAQVYFEFLKNKDKVSVKPAQAYKSLLTKPANGADGGHIENIKRISDELDKKAIIGLKNQLKTLKEKTKVSDKHPYIDQRNFEEIDSDIAKFESQIKTFQEKINVFVNDLTPTINEKVECISDNVDDLISAMVINNFKIGNEISYSQMVDIAKEGEFRYKEEIPPGYEDAKDKIGLQKYGDLFAWKQILMYAKDKKRDVILITNDVKEDWYDIDTQAPRFELLKEFNSETGKNFWTFNMKDFLFKMNQLLDSGERSLDAAIAEVDVIQHEKTNIQAVGNFDISYYKMLLQDLWCVEIDIDNDVLDEVPYFPNRKKGKTPHLFKITRQDGRKNLILIYEVKGANYTSALLPLRTIFEIKKHFEDLGEEYEYDLFILAPTFSSAIALSKHLNRDNIKLLYNNLEVKSYIGHIIDNKIAILACNYAAG